MRTQDRGVPSPRPRDRDMCKAPSSTCTRRQVDKMVVGTVTRRYTSQVRHVPFPSAGDHRSRSSWPGLWIHKDFQDRLVWLWTQVAQRYKDDPWVAGHNSMNEPADPQGTRGLVRFYDGVYEAIRSVDENHVVFLDGNTYSIDCSTFPEDAQDRWKNTAYSRCK